MTSPNPYVPKGVSPLPWEVDNEPADGFLRSTGSLKAILGPNDFAAGSEEDMAYIAHAANTLPEALALLEDMLRDEVTNGEHDCRFGVGDRYCLVHLYSAPCVVGRARALLSKDREAAQ